MNFFNANGTYPNGKYMFNDFANITVCNEFFDSGNCKSGIHYSFKKGDVIDVTAQSFDDMNQEYLAQLPIPELATVPFSILTKVDDSTPVTTNFEKNSFNIEIDAAPIYDTGGGMRGGIPDEEKVVNPKSDCDPYSSIFKFHCWEKDRQIASVIGLIGFAGYGVYKKKTPLAIAGLGLLGGLSGLIFISMKPKNHANLTAPKLTSQQLEDLSYCTQSCNRGASEESIKNCIKNCLKFQATQH